MNAVEAIEIIKALDDGEWAESFDSLGMWVFLDTLSNVQHDRPTSTKKLVDLAEYMKKVTSMNAT